SGDEVLDYCEADVTALGLLLQRMQPSLDLPRALLRGRYMAAVAAMEWSGVPIDVDTLEQLRERWSDIKLRLIEEIDRDFGVYAGTTFKQAKFEHWLARHAIPWPRLPSTGRLDLADETFRSQATVYPAVAPLWELRSTMAKLRLSDLAVGRDG